MSNIGVISGHSVAFMLTNVSREPRGTNENLWDTMGMLLNRDWLTWGVDEQTLGRIIG